MINIQLLLLLFVTFPPRSWSDNFVRLFTIRWNGQTFGWTCGKFLFNKEIRSKVFLQMTFDQLDTLLLFFSRKWCNHIRLTVLASSGLDYCLLDSLSDELSCLRNCLEFSIRLVSSVFHFLLARFPNVRFLSFVVELVYDRLYFYRLCLLWPFWHSPAIQIPLELTLRRWNPLLGSVDCGLSFFLKYFALLSLVIEEICWVLVNLRGILIKRLFKLVITVLITHHLRKILVDGVVPYSCISSMCGKWAWLFYICGGEILVARLLICLLFFLVEKLVWNVASSLFVLRLHWKGRSWWQLLWAESWFNRRPADWIGRSLSFFINTDPFVHSQP